MEMPGPTISVIELISIIVLSMLAVVVFLAWVMKRSDRALWRPIAQAMGAQVVSAGFGSYLKTLEGGLEARVYYHGKSRRPHFITFELRSPFPVKVRFFVDRKLARRPELRPRISAFLTMDDQHLSGLFEVNASDEDAGLRFLENPVRREALQYFFNNDFSEVEITRTRVKAGLYQLDDQALAPKRLKAHLDELRKLAG